MQTDHLRTKLFIRAELVRQCMDMPKEERPFDPYNPGSDPKFHDMVADIQADVPQIIADLVSETFAQ